LSESEERAREESKRGRGEKKNLKKVKK